MKPIRVKGWVADSYVLDTEPSFVDENKYVLKLHPENPRVFEELEALVHQRKLEAEQPFPREGVFSQSERYKDRLFDDSKVVFETLIQPSLTGNLKRVQRDEELLGKFVEAVGHIQILKGGNAFFSVHLIDEAARSLAELDPFS